MARADDLLENLFSIEAHLRVAAKLTNTYFDDVEDFLSKYDVPVAPIPTLPSDELIAFGFKHLAEELKEIEAALAEGDMVAVSDGLADLIYVALNFAARMGIPFNEVWDAVHKANMNGKRKVRSADESKRGYIHDVIKTNGFVPPEIEIRAALVAAGADPSMAYKQVNL